MTDTANTPSPAPLQAENAAPAELSGLNARTARRQKLLLGSLGALALLAIDGSLPAALNPLAWLRVARGLRDAVIVSIICDRGDRYLSTGVFPG